MSARDEERRREAIASTAQTWREATGNRISQSEAESRVREAVRQGDAKRDNDNR